MKPASVPPSQEYWLGEGGHDHPEAGAALIPPCPDLHGHLRGRNLLQRSWKINNNGGVPAFPRSSLPFIVAPDSRRGTAVPPNVPGRPHLDLPSV